MTTKTTSIHTRMTPDEYNILQIIAAQDRLNISETIRRLIRNEASRRQGFFLLGDLGKIQGSEAE